MYLTAHYVRSKSRIEGINAFLHHHGPHFAWPDDASALADEEPGKIVRERVDLPRGFNHVRSYLDVLAPDGTPNAKLTAAITALTSALDDQPNPTVFTHGNVTIRFGVELGLERLRAEQLAMLTTAAFALLEQG